MAKRFIDTELFNDSWFMKLNPKSKLFYIYCFTNCNHAGIIDLNIELAQFKTKIKDLTKTFNTVCKELNNIENEPRFVHLTKTYYYLPKYINYQYPDFPKSNVRQQESAINILKKFNLIDEDLTLIKEFNNSYDNVSVIDNDNVKIKGNHLFKNSEYYDYEEFHNAIKDYANGKYKAADINYYYEAVKNWSASKNIMRKDWIATAANFMIRDIGSDKFKVKKGLYKNK